MNTIADTPVTRALAGQANTNASATTADNSTITANDFLTLLVAQMKNQDPTSPTDPSQYMQQLVGVNSLQQLISINQHLSSTTSTTNANKQA